MKKYLAEMVGTMVLVLMGCGVAVSLGCDPVNNIPAVVGTALAFGLAVVAMAYTIGGISGCHINPAITLGCIIAGRMDAKEGIMYIVFQCIGAFIGSALLAVLVANVPGMARRDYLHLCIRACSAWRNSKDQRCYQQFCRTGNWSEPRARSPRMYPLYRHIGESSPLARSRYFPGWHSTGQPVDLHRRSLRRWRTGSLHLEAHRAC